MGDNAYDSDGLDERLQKQGIHLIAPNRANRRRTQDARGLRRYRRRWLVERIWAWLQSFRRIALRHEEDACCERQFAVLLGLGGPVETVYSFG